jgi:hypothetical protein
MRNHKIRGLHYSGFTRNLSQEVDLICFKGYGLFTNTVIDNPADLHAIRPCNNVQKLPDEAISSSFHCSWGSFDWAVKLTFLLGWQKPIFHPRFGVRRSRHLKLFPE